MGAKKKFYCGDCGVEIVKDGAPRKYCSACSIVRSKMYASNYKLRKKGDKKR
jgi:hypothetical protein